MIVQPILYTQYDKKWESDRGFVFYDFNDLNTIPASMHGTCDLVVVDPPFIVREVWEKYAAAVKLLVKPGKEESTGMHQSCFQHLVRPCCSSRVVMLTSFLACVHQGCQRGR
jgi:hypothetical protein